MAYYTILHSTTQCSLIQTLSHGLYSLLLLPQAASNSCFCLNYSHLFRASASIYHSWTPLIILGFFSERYQPLQFRLTILLLWSICIVNTWFLSKHYSCTTGNLAEKIAAENAMRNIVSVWQVWSNY